MLVDGLNLGVKSNARAARERSTGPTRQGGRARPSRVLSKESSHSAGKTIDARAQYCE